MLKYAGVILARFDFVEEKDRAEFHDLAIFILLNSVACLCKKKEFIQVGQICSVILDFKPNNIKAFFRRALAAIKLGRKNLAYWDFLMAIELEPGNEEVIMKLKEVKSILNQEKKILNLKLMYQLDLKWDLLLQKS
ncbi:Peptidyl-prolyl cis-trans isomerase FKBP62 [Bienertia sinuspersici]